MPNQICFVYYNAEQNKIKVLNLDNDNDKIQKNELLKSGWKHTATIDPCIWIEYLFNNAEDVDIIADVKELANINQ